MFSKEQIEELLSRIEFLNFRFQLDFISEDKIHLRIISYMPDNNDRSKKCDMTSFHHIMVENTKSEVNLLRSIYNAILEKMRHEASEIFKFGGEDIFNEHYDINDERRTNIIRSIIDISTLKKQ